MPGSPGRRVLTTVARHIPTATNYYVRKSGSDANNGTTPAQAKLTIGAGIALLTPGGSDRLYVGPGVYRERPVFNRNGHSVGLEHQIIADHFGEYTTDAPGVVRISAMNANDDGVDRAGAIEIDASYIRIVGFLLHGASDTKARGNAVAYCNPSVTRWGVILEDCLLDPAGGDSLLQFGMTARTEVTLRRCIGRSRGDWMAFGGANGRDILNLESCWIEGWQGDQYFAADDAANDWIINVQRCHFGPGRAGAFIGHYGGFTTITVRNSLCRIGSDMGVTDGGGTLTFTHEYNRWEGNAPSPLGTGETIGWGGDILLWALQRSLSTYSEIGVDAGSGGPARDLFGRTVPQGSAPGLGPAESSDYPERDTTVFRTNAPSMRSRPGRRLLHRFFWGVRAQEETFEVWVRYNTSYTSAPRPRLIIKANPAIGLQTDTFSEAPSGQADTWLNLQVKVTPTASGVVEVWLETYSTESGAQVRFDDFVGPIFPS